MENSDIEAGEFGQNEHSALSESLSIHHLRPKEHSLGRISQSAAPPTFFMLEGPIDRATGALPSGKTTERDGDSLENAIIPYYYII